MILVINLNASVDKRYELEDIKKGSVIRAKTVENTPGGKGIHVANVATILKEDCLVTGFLGGKTGEFIKERLKDYNIEEDFINIKEDTRECLAFTTNDLVQTEILEPGPSVSEEEKQSFLDKYNELIDKSTIVVASGSVPKNIESSFYKELIRIANAKGKKFLLDTSGELLRKGIEEKPYFIKPNKDEIECFTGKVIKSDEDAISEIKKFQEMGVRLVVISLGAEGSIAGYNGKFYKITFPKVHAINTVGSGDSYVAGVAIALNRGYDIKELLKLASACGTANSLEKETGFVREDVVLDLIDKVSVEEFI
ncbi:MAG: 1-phosphofructokinase family hexose kinase [Clostridium perfringens]|nr:1-phosphofructokinase family hexose kinase [Clostridium perfringens]